MTHIFGSPDARAWHAAPRHAFTHLPGHTHRIADDIAVNAAAIGFVNAAAGGREKFRKSKPAQRSPASNRHCGNRCCQSQSLHPRISLRWRISGLTSIGRCAAHLGTNARAKARLKLEHLRRPSLLLQPLLIWDVEVLLRQLLLLRARLQLSLSTHKRELH